MSIPATFSNGFRPLSTLPPLRPDDAPESPVVKKTNTAGLAAIHAEPIHRTIHKVSCCNRFGSFVQCLTFPFSWLILRIIDVVKSLIKCCNDTSLDEPVPTEPTDPIVPAETGGVLDDSDKAKKLHAASIALIKQIEDFSAGVEVVKKELTDLVGQQTLSKFQLIHETIENFKGTPAALHAKVKKHQDEIEKLRSDDVDEDTHKSLKEDIEKINSKQGVIEDSKGKIDSLIVEWNVILASRKNDLCLQFQQLQKDMTNKIPALIKQGNSAFDSNGNPIDAKLEGINLFKTYIQLFTFLKQFNWVQENEEHKTILDLRASLAAALGMPNFKSGNSNICWMNATCQAMRLSPKLMAKLKDNVPLKTAEEELKKSFSALLDSLNNLSTEDITKTQTQLKDALNALRSNRGPQADRAGSDQADAEELILRPLLTILGYSMDVSLKREAPSEKPLIIQDNVSVWSIGFPEKPRTPTGQQLKYMDLIQRARVEAVDDPTNAWRGQSKISHSKYTITSQLIQAPEVLVMQLKRFSQEGGPTARQRHQMSVGMEKLLQDVTNDKTRKIARNDMLEITEKLLGKPQFVKIDDDVSMEAVLDLTNTDMIAGGQAARYKLRSCIIHHGGKSAGTGSGGHYTAIGKDEDGVWRAYDDDVSVKKLTEKEALEVAAGSYIQIWEKE